MQRPRPSARLAALVIASLVLAAPLVAATPAALQSVGEILLDGEGRASGANLVAQLGSGPDVLRAFGIPGRGAVFEKVTIAGFDARETAAGAGSPTLLIAGPPAIVALHDDARSVLHVHALESTTLTYRLAPGVSATTEGAHGGIVRLSSAAGAIGALVVAGAEGAASKGETVSASAREVVVRAQSGSDVVFLAARAGAIEDALVDALSGGSLASYYVTEWSASRVAQSSATFGNATASTRALADGAIESALVAKRPSIVLFDLAYETLPARDADQVAVFVDGERLPRAASPGDVLARGKDGVPSYHAVAGDGRTQVIAYAPFAGEHRIVVSLSAQAGTEPQARAEQERDDEARAYGSFEHHANGKLTGAFLTGVLPAERAELLAFTPLAQRAELFRRVSVDGGAQARFHSPAQDELRVATANATLTLFDDAHTTLLLDAHAPTRAGFEPASGIRAHQLADDIVLLESDAGPAGALVLAGEGALLLHDGIQARLAPGARLVFRGAGDAFASEPALQRALADGALAAQLVANAHDARAIVYRAGVAATARAVAEGAIEIAYVAGDAPGALALDARGAALAAKSASDVRVLVDGVEAARAEDAAGALAPTEGARYHVETAASGALRVLVSPASAPGKTARITIQSALAATARARSGADAFGDFRLFDDGTAVGDFVSLQLDRDAGVVSGFTLVATGKPVFASFVVGASPYARVGGEGAHALTLENGDARVDVSDSTNAFTRILATRDTRAAFHLAEGMRAQSRSERVIDLLDAGGHAASLVLRGAGSLEARGEQDVRAELSATSEILFRTHDGIESELSAAQRAMINDAIGAGRVAGHVLVQTPRDAASVASASYGDVTLGTTATRERVEITVDSATSRGKTLLVSLDPRTIPGMALGKARIGVDGHTAAQAASYADVLEATDDGDVAEYFVLAGDAGTQVLVSIPHFSVRTVTLEQAERSDALWLVATIFLALLALVEGVLLARKRKNVTNTRRP